MSLMSFMTSVRHASRFDRPFGWPGCHALAAACLVLGAPAWAQQGDQSLTPGAPGAAAMAAAVGSQASKDKDDKPEFPEFKEVTKDYVKVVSSADGADSMWTLWRREKDNQLLAELPREFERERFLFAMTVARGSPWAGMQGGDYYVYWKRVDKNLMLIEPNLGTRSTGDAQSKSSVERLFTDRVVLDVPILTMGPGGGPVIDLDALLVGKADAFFGPQLQRLSPALSVIKEAKSFPQNIEISIETPMPSSSAQTLSGVSNAGRLRTLHYSISAVRASADYKPRDADQRVGYFTTTYRDLGKLGAPDKWVRLVNRWHLEKADSKLRLSPPERPIVFYIESDVPVRYRRWVRDGVLMWNKAFERVGIAGAIEVAQQDASSGAHMEKDPEDVRYNFIRWLSNDVSTASASFRTNPLTGQILDADIVLTDGWIRAFWSLSTEIAPDLAVEGMHPYTLEWMQSRPRWDPRLRLASPSTRARMLQERAAVDSRRGVQRYAGAPVLAGEQNADDDMPWGNARGVMGAHCMAAQGRVMDMAAMAMELQIMGLLDADEPKEPAADAKEPAKDSSKEPQKLDGIPESFVGPMLSDLVAHEVGHALGLRHNFKGSSIYTMAQINSDEWRGKRPIGGSIMDYNALPNINLGQGPVQGDFGMIDVGPYDLWAIAYGYTSEDPKKILERVAEPELLYATDEDTWGPDPRARRRDMGSDPLTFAKSRVELAANLRERIVERFVKDGDSWAKARRGYNITLDQQFNSLSVMANWIGGAYINRDKKGDPGARPPIEPVPAQTQRDALAFVIQNTFRDEAFALTPDLLNKMSVDKWWDEGGFLQIFEDESWPIHDRILGFQAAILSLLMNPTTLGRVFDNEYRVPAEQDMITLPETLDAVRAGIWGEIEQDLSRQFTARQPMISSLRRNLQREHLELLIDLAGPGAVYGSAGQVVSTLVTSTLRTLKERLDALVTRDAARLDPYTTAHLSECALRIKQVLDAQVIYNTDDLQGGGGFFFLLGNQAQTAPGTPGAPGSPIASP